MKPPISAFILSALTFVATAHAEEAAQSRTQSVELTGVVVTLHDLFELVGEQAEPDAHWLTNRAIVVDDTQRLYSFLETPNNETALQEVAPGQSVQIKADWLSDSGLLSVSEVALLDEAIEVRLDELKQAKGKPVTLEGRNACQCQLDVDALASSCELGHLHHLQTDEGVIYQYLPTDKSDANLKGSGTHGRRVTVEASLLPGHHLHVTSTRVH